MKILMVCLGNICRSPVAEGIMRHKVQSQNLNITTDSAGTSSFHIGEQPDSRMIAAAKRNGIDISDLRARQFVKADFDAFDLIYVMDKSNYDDVIALARNDADREKVRLILNETYTGEDMNVPDPYFGGEAGFQHVIDLLDVAVDKLLERMND